MFKLLRNIAPDTAIVDEKIKEYVKEQVVSYKASDDAKAAVILNDKLKELVVGQGDLIIEKKEFEENVSMYVKEALQGKLDTVPMPTPTPLLPTLKGMGNR